MEKSQSASDTSKSGNSSRRRCSNTLLVQRRDCYIFPVSLLLNVNVIVVTFKSKTAFLYS
ncbi:unnamed protein product [Brassica rapa subsp. narinosa]